MNTSDRSTELKGIASATHPNGNTPVIGPRWEPLGLIQNRMNESYQPGYFIDIADQERSFTNVNFSFSIFVRAYFHNARFDRCTLTVCWFDDCNSQGTSFIGCYF